MEKKKQNSFPLVHQAPMAKASQDQSQKPQKTSGSNGKMASDQALGPDAFKGVCFRRGAPRT